MRTLLLITVLLINTFCYGQSKLEGTYSNFFGEKIEFRKDLTFKHSWYFDLASSWTEGTYKMFNDTVYLRTKLVLDTLEILNNKNEFVKDSLVVSVDNESNRIDIIEFASSGISGGGQNRLKPPDELIIKRNKLYRLDEMGKLKIKKDKIYRQLKNIRLTFSKKNKNQCITQYILQGGVRWYANCGFSFRSSVSFGQERSSKSAPTTCTNRCAAFEK
ncbi:hypothetical protein FHS59_000575 [Algoriphagus iocasae]|uniref:Uncharacterized protein n=1 Tax=Algoriphagus iocasae TaxID=1836499 RepID=A0A841MCC4_9BACT|nr:hypothetical protein [Algoriphagus iocasae]MBB6324960.1 hypothetical protein [Algoriphagus iocasae]